MAATFRQYHQTHHCHQCRLTTYPFLLLDFKSLLRKPSLQLSFSKTELLQTKGFVPVDSLGLSGTLLSPLFVFDLLSYTQKLLFICDSEETLWTYQAPSQNFWPSEITRAPINLWFRYFLPSFSYLNIYKILYLFHS